MTRVLVLGVLTFVLFAGCKGKDLGFRIQIDAENGSARCLNAKGEEGLNPGWIGPCGDLRGVDLEGKELTGRRRGPGERDFFDLRGANFSGANLARAKFGQVDLSYAVLDGADFREADLTQVRFVKADLSNVRFEDAVLFNCWFSEAKFQGSRFLPARAGFSNFARADFRGVDLRESVMTEDYSGADFRDVSFEGAQIDLGTFWGADFRGADLSRARIESLDIMRARLAFLRARYDKRTLLPFSADVAEQMSMVFVNND